MYFTPIGINDWYLLTVVPMEVANTKTMDIMKLNYVRGSTRDEGSFRHRSICPGIIFFTVRLLKNIRIFSENMKFLRSWFRWRLRKVSCQRMRCC